MKLALRESESESTQTDKNPIWVVLNGVVLWAAYSTKEKAIARAVELQKNHDLSGDLASFKVTKYDIVRH